MVSTIFSYSPVKPPKPITFQAECRSVTKFQELVQLKRVEKHVLAACHACTNILAFHCILIIRHLMPTQFQSIFCNLILELQISLCLNVIRHDITCILNFASAAILSLRMTNASERRVIFSQCRSRPHQARTMVVRCLHQRVNRCFSSTGYFYD